MQVVSSTTTRPPEPTIAPVAASRLVVDRRVEHVGRQAASGRAAELHGLELAARQHAAADVEDDVAQRGPHGHLDEAAVGDLAGQREDLGAARRAHAHGGEVVGAVR